MSNYNRTKGNGWNVFLSDDQLFVVNTTTGVRTAEFAVDNELVETLKKALSSRKEVDPAEAEPGKEEEVEASEEVAEQPTPKKTTSKKTTSKKTTKKAEQ